MYSTLEFGMLETFAGFDLYKKLSIDGAMALKNELMNSSYRVKTGSFQANNQICYNQYLVSEVSLIIGGIPFCQMAIGCSMGKVNSLIWLLMHDM